MHIRETDSYLVKVYKIPRHKHPCFNLYNMPTQDSALARERLLQLVDNVSGMEFLNEANRGIEQ